MCGERSPSCSYQRALTAAGDLRRPGVGSLAEAVEMSASAGGSTPEHGVAFELEAVAEAFGSH